MVSLLTFPVCFWPDRFTRPSRRPGDPCVQDIILCHGSAYSPELLDSTDPPASAPQVAGTTGMHHHTQLPSLDLSNVPFLLFVILDIISWLPVTEDEPMSLVLFTPCVFILSHPAEIKCHNIFTLLTMSVSLTAEPRSVMKWFPPQTTVCSSWGVGWALSHFVPWLGVLCTHI